MVGIAHDSKSCNLGGVKVGLASKFNRSICHRCRIAPICGGGCTQLSLEAEDTEGCPRGLSEADIDKLILDRFDFMFLSNDKEEAYTKHC